MSHLQEHSTGTVGHWADRIVARPMAYAHKSDEEVAGMVRMLMRDDLDHEGVCLAARDRIAKLSHDVESVQSEFSAMHRRITELQDYASRQSREIEDLKGMADAVEVLRDLGRVFGCDHVDDPDGRRQLVNCIDQEFQRVNDERDKAQAEVARLNQTLAEDCCLKSEASQRIFNAQNEAAQIYNPLIAELRQEAASLRNETATANLSRLELQNLARRVVEIFEPMQQKGQNGHTFELLLERAKKCLATYSEMRSPPVAAESP